MPYDEKTSTEVVLKTVYCPAFNRAINLDDCVKCQYHGGIQDVKANQFQDGNTVEVLVGQKVLCSRPVLITVGEVHGVKK